MSNTNGTKPRAEIRTITPIWAKDVLEKHDASVTAGKFNQRPLAEKTVALYAADMKAGNWALTGQGISFDKDNNLLDGQHRLAAVVKANIPIQMLVIWDLESSVNPRLKTLDTFDIGKKRNLGQQLKIDGFTWYSEIATTSRLLIMLANGNKKLNLTSPQGIAVAHMMQNNIHHILQILARNSAPKSKFRGSIIAPLVLLHTTDPDVADLFATEFNEMTGLSKTSPILHFARFLERPTTAKFGTDYQLLVMSALSSALYNYSNDKRVDIIRGNKDHVEWLLKTCKNCVFKIREISGVDLTVSGGGGGAKFATD